ncbi:SAV_915 family protein [Kitasatospora sp. NPDC088346]|uniref:SAV_915 family protein n=1 Tax=Kitasatospora sp. NPDC088346 TaxID=3364073 RepID=UPI00381C6742
MTSSEPAPAEPVEPRPVPPVLPAPPVLPVPAVLPVLHVPVGNGGNGGNARALRLFRQRDGGRCAVAFSSAAALTALLGPAQGAVRLSEPALRALAAPLGVTALVVDPQLVAPAAAPPTPVVGPTARPLHALVRFSHGPVPLDFERLAARVPAVRAGLALAGDVDLELRLTCADRHELASVVAELRRAGAAGIRVDLVLRRLLPPAPVLPAASLPRSAAA